MRASVLRLTPILTVLLLTAYARADVVVTANAPAGTVSTGGEVTVDVYFLNTGPAAAPVDMPAALPCRLVTPSGQIHAATMRRTSAAPAAAADVAAGAFARATYALPLPPGVGAGRVVVELDRPGTPRTAVVVAGPPGDQPAGAPAGDRGAVGDEATAATAPGDRRQPLTPTAERGDSGIAQYTPARFTGHEPMYFLVGPDEPTAKFQISFKYQLLNPEGTLAQAVPALGGIHVAYNQTSFWDLGADSSPFFDTSYRPEVLWSANDLRLATTPDFVSRLGLQVGLQHESNGRGGVDSRSMNTVYVRPTFTFGDASGDGLFLTVAPKVFAYVGDVDDNRDIKDYRGYGELRTVLGWQKGLQLSTTGRMGDDWDKGSVQFDLSYPLRDVLGRNVDLFLHAQYFNGFGESLLNYNESTSAFRLGVSLVR